MTLTPCLAGPAMQRIQQASSPQRWGQLPLAVARAGPVHLPHPKVMHHRRQARSNAPSRPPAPPMPLPPASRQVAAAPAATAKPMSPQPTPRPAAAEQFAVPAAGMHARGAAGIGRASLACHPATGLSGRNLTEDQIDGTPGEAAAVSLGGHRPGRPAALAPYVGNQACRPCAEAVRLSGGGGVGQQSVADSLSGLPHCATAALVASRAGRTLQQPARLTEQSAGYAPLPVAQPGTVSLRGTAALPTPHARQLPAAARAGTAPTGSAAPLPGETALLGADRGSQSASEPAGSWSWLGLAGKAAGAQRPTSADTADADSHAQRLQTASFEAVVAAAVDQACLCCQIISL